MNDFTAQCWICPWCFDDHGVDENACKVSDLREQIASLREQLQATEIGFYAGRSWECFTIDDNIRWTFPTFADWLASKQKDIEKFMRWRIRK